MICMENKVMLLTCLECTYQSSKRKMLPNSFHYEKKKVKAVRRSDVWSIYGQS